MVQPTPISNPYIPQQSRKGPLLILAVMAILFITLLAKLISDYKTVYLKDAPTESKPAAPPASAPATLPANRSLPAEDAVPAGAGFTARNLEFEGNLTALTESDGKPLGLDDPMHRMATLIGRIPGDRLSAKATQMPPMKDLLENAAAYRGCVFAVRIVPAEINDHENDLPVGRVRSWRTYGMLQRSTSEFVVFEGLEPPPMRNWTLKRDVIEVEAVFIRLASYKTSRGDKTVTVPYLIPKSYQLVFEDTSASPVGISNIVYSKYGAVVVLGLMTVVGLTLWTLRRHGRMLEKQERDQFYGLLRAKKRPAKEWKHTTNK
ncbi:MAG: hypothetical protein HY286_05835 [Planctomycetes bacterium]|nr:hypothetical protein [Planctomycetota bacterium]